MISIASPAISATLLRPGQLSPGANLAARTSRHYNWTMCGIVGYVGGSQAAPILLDGLRRLEYRGYDSAGVAIVNGDGVETRKCAGRIASLAKLVTEKPPAGTYG